MAPWHCSAWRAVCFVSVENGGSSFVEGHITVVSFVRMHGVAVEIFCYMA